MTFLYGLGAGVLSAVAVKPLLRGLLRGAMVGTMVVGQKAKRFKTEIMEEIEDVKAEAEAEAKVKFDDNPKD